MIISPKWISLIVSLLIAGISVAFLSFVPDVNAAMLFVVGVCAFLSSFVLIYYIIDLLVFQEVNKIYLSLKSLKINDFSIARKSLIRSVNPLKKLNSEISTFATKKQEEIASLHKMEAFRREFIADVSHDLKTPIFAAQGFIHTLLDGAMDDPTVSKKFLTKAAKSLDGLEVLVKDILVLTQVESGDIRMHFEVFNIVQLVSEIFEQLEKKAAEKEIKFMLKPKEIKSIMVFADRLRIYQVLTNLISNSLIYGKLNGKVVVEINNEKHKSVIQVHDDGIGIPEEHLPRIFERFYRIDKSRPRSQGSTGLGLAIVKHILNAHDTTIDVSSKLDKGTSFTFTLPTKDFS